MFVWKSNNCFRNARQIIFRFAICKRSYCSLFAHLGIHHILTVMSPTKFPLRIFRAANWILDNFSITLDARSCWGRTDGQNVTLLKYVLKPGMQSVRSACQDMIRGSISLSAATFAFSAIPRISVMAVTSVLSPVKTAVTSLTAFRILV